MRKMPVEYNSVSKEHCGARLNHLFPGRKDQIEDLLSVFGEPWDTFPPLLIYGGPATGKTIILREAVRVLQRPHAYVSCRSCHNPRLLFESVINQLFGHIRCKKNNYASAKKCEKVSDFIAQLIDACVSKQSSLNLDEEQGLKRVVYLIFDNADLLRKWTGGGVLMSALLKLSDLTRLPYLGIIFVSNAGPDNFQLDVPSREPIPLYFRDYTNEELFQILAKCHPTSDLYSFFLNATLTTFSRATKRLTELSVTLQPLFEKFCQPVILGQVMPNAHGKRQLFSKVKSHIQPALSRTFSFAEVKSGATFGDANRNSGSKRTTADMEFHLARTSKYLLIAAYIASRNPSTLDDALFGSGDAGKTKRVRRNAMEKKEAEMEEKHLKGPGSFPLERLLAIFHCLSSDCEIITEDAGGSHPLPGQPEEVGTSELTADVLMLLSTLASVNLVLKGSSNLLDGIPRYRCNVDEEFIYKVANSIHFPLSKYLLHG